MDILILANLSMFAVALYMSICKMAKDREMRMFRLSAVFISFYIFTIYLLSVIGAIPEESIRNYMRWFQLVVAAYIMLETKHG